MDTKKNYYALITGSSSGIGRAMAEECAGRGRHLLLVALEEPALHETARSIREQYGVKVHCLGIDLTEETAPRQVLDWCRENEFRVNVLINNAGFGRGGLFEHTPLEEYFTMLKLNNQAAIGLTYLFIPELRRHAPSHILNTSSMEATLALPYKAAYTGTKHFLYGFSLAIREELREDGVNVSVLCPGPTVTNEDGLRRIQAQGRKAKVLVSMPEDVAREAITGLFRRRQVIIPGKVPRLIVRLMHWFPTSVKMRILERVFRPYKYQGKLAKAEGVSL